MTDLLKTIIFSHDVEFAPYDEQFIHKLERSTFWNDSTDSSFTFDVLANQIKKYGCCGVTHLNENHIKACFAQADSNCTRDAQKRARNIYFKDELGN